MNSSDMKMEFGKKVSGLVLVSFVTKWNPIKNSGL
jgi:hypothetical protein